MPIIISGTLMACSEASGALSLRNVDMMHDVHHHHVACKHLDWCQI